VTARGKRTRLIETTLGKMSHECVSVTEQVMHCDQFVSKI